MVICRGNKLQTPINLVVEIYVYLQTSRAHPHPFSVFHPLYRSCNSCSLYFFVVNYCAIRSVFLRYLNDSLYPRSFPKPVLQWCVTHAAALDMRTTGAYLASQVASMETTEIFIYIYLYIGWGNWMIIFAFSMQNLNIKSSLFLFTNMQTISPRLKLNIFLGLREETTDSLRENNCLNTCISFWTFSL